MPRPYHSPSSIALGKHCQSAWARTYIEGQRDPDVAWTDDFLTYKWDHGTARYWAPDESASISAQQRGAALGKGMHATAERWYDPSRGVADWSWFPGLVLAAGKHLLPEPSKIERVIIERPIGTVALPPRAQVREGQPTVAIRVHGILWSGFIDNEAHGGDELRRLKINAPDGVAIFDYKSCSDFEKFALTHDELLTDPQAALYAIAVCEKLGLKSIPERWVYFANKKKRQAIPIDATAEFSRALDVLGPCADLARELDTLTRVEDAPQNPAACYMYGNPERINCRFHVVNGGKCNAWGAFRQLLQIKKKEEITQMAEALTKEQRDAAFAKKKADMAAAKAAREAGATTASKEEPKPEPEADEPPSEEPSGGSPGIENPEPAPAKPAAAAKPTVAKAKPAEGSQAATISALALELAAADKARDAVLAKLRAAVA